MGPLELFSKMRDVCDDVVKAYESNDQKQIESAMGRFLFVCMEMDRWVGPPKK